MLAECLTVVWCMYRWTTLQRVVGTENKIIIMNNLKFTEHFLYALSHVTIIKSPKRAELMVLPLSEMRETDF